MVQWRKLLARVERNPRHVEFGELDQLLKRAGFERRQPRGGSSHYVYTKVDKSIVVPYRRPHVREHYVKDAIALIRDELGE